MGHMGQIFRLDSSGHGTVIKWNADNSREVQAARETFDRYRAMGFTMFRLDEDDEQGERMTTFDPEASGILAVPRMQGG